MDGKGHWLEMNTWARASTFEFYRSFESPFFTLCTSVDVGPTVSACREGGSSFFLASWYACMKAANRVAAFRQRVRGDRVWEHDRIFVGTTVLRDDDSFGYCYFPHAEDFGRFTEEGRRALAAFHGGTPAELAATDRDDLVHGSVIPWIEFTAMTHARRVPATDSVPKVVYGRYVDTGGVVRMPVSVDVHHAVADGLHVGRFLASLQDLLTTPETWM